MDDGSNPEWMLTTRPLAANARVAYAPGDFHFGDLYLPAKKGPHPVVVAIHGGFWRAEYDLTHLGHACAALAKLGYAVWSLEYRRLGNPGGGYPGTLEDVARGTDFLRELAPKHGLDLTHVVSLGHSAGGHLALWLAARHKLPSPSPLHRRSPLALRGVVALAAVSDLARGAQLHLSNDVVQQLMGGEEKAKGPEYAFASPAALLPLGVAQRLVHGTRDDIVPFAMSAAYATRAQALMDPVQLIPVPHGSHFDVINPRNEDAWKLVVTALQSL